MTLAGTLSEGTNTLTVAGPGNTSFTSASIISGTIAAGSNALIKTGSGILTLDGADTFTGQTTISQGIINIQNASALGATGAGNGTVVASGAALRAAGRRQRVRANLHRRPGGE